MTAYYAYLRAATRQQLDGQRLEVKEYAKERNFKIKSFFEDVGVSARLQPTELTDGIKKRHGLMSMIDELIKGDVVIVTNTNRLWRNDTSKASIVRELKKRRAIVYSVEQPKFDLYNKLPSQYLEELLHEAFSEYFYMKHIAALENTEALR